MLLSKRAPLVAREGGKGVQVSHFSPDNQALLQNRWTLIIIRSEWGGEGWCKGLVLVNGDAENDDDHFWKKLKCKQEPMIINNHDNFGFEDFLMFLIC